MLNKIQDTVTIKVTSLDEIRLKLDNRVIKDFFLDANVVQSLSLDTCDKLFFIDKNCNILYEIFNSSGRSCMQDRVVCVNLDQL